MSFEIGNINHQNKGQIVGKLSLNNTNVSSGFPYRLLSPSGGHINNIQNSPLSLQPCTSSFSNTVSPVVQGCRGISISKIHKKILFYNHNFVKFLDKSWNIVHGRSSGRPQ